MPRPLARRKPDALDASTPSRAFTLIELLVVIAIVATLLSILLPSMMDARETARRIKCLSGLHQMNIAATAYLNANKGSYPIAYIGQQVGTTTYSYCWDLTTLSEAGRVPRVLSGLLRGPHRSSNARRSKVMRTGLWIRTPGTTSTPATSDTASSKTSFLLLRIPASLIRPTRPSSAMGNTPPEQTSSCEHPLTARATTLSTAGGQAHRDIVIKS